MPSDSYQIDKRTVVIAGITAGVAAVILLASYLLSPFLAAHSLAAAVRSNDREALAVRVDFPLVRESLKEQFSAALSNKLESDKELKDNPFAGLAVVIVNVVVDKAVDTLVTPDGMQQALSRPMDDKSHSPGTTEQWASHGSYVDLDHFRMRYSKRSDPAIEFGLLFERRGLFSWKLVRLSLPLDEIMKRGQSAGQEKESSAAPEGMRSPEPQQNATATDGMPMAIDVCVKKSIAKITTRLQDENGNEVPGSGSEIQYENGGRQVSYDSVPAIEHSQIGDTVQICLVQLPEDCPPGDNRGKIYSATNQRTGEKWILPDSEHSCGGA